MILHLPDGREITGEPFEMHRLLVDLVEQFDENIHRAHEESEARIAAARAGIDKRNEVIDSVRRPRLRVIAGGVA